MKRDGCYNSLEVRQLLKVNTISAKKVLLEDATLESNPSMLGSRIKKLYEQQKDTNVFTDDDRDFVRELRKLISTGANHVHMDGIQYTKLVHIEDIDDSAMPDNTSCLCVTEENEIVHKIKHNGNISIANIQKPEKHISSQLSVNEDDSVSINLNIA